jgi:hypothetical protein
VLPYPGVVEGVADCLIEVEDRLRKTVRGGGAIQRVEQVGQAECSVPLGATLRRVGEDLFVQVQRCDGCLEPLRGCTERVHPGFP